MRYDVPPLIHILSDCCQVSRLIKTAAKLLAIAIRRPSLTTSVRSGSGKLTADIHQLNQSGPVQGISARQRKRKQGKTKQRKIKRRDSCLRASLASTIHRVCHSNPAASSLGENRGHSVGGRGEVLPTCRLKGPVCKAATDFDRYQQIIGSRASGDRGAAVSSGSLPSLRSLPLKKTKFSGTRSFSVQHHIAFRLVSHWHAVNDQKVSREMATAVPLTVS